jgi:RNA polymerase sigma-70 factor (ECF subfamily)
MIDHLMFAPALDDETLARQADSAAFDELSRRYLKRVYRYLLSRVQNEQDAQDLTAQTFLAAWESMDSFENRGAFPAWLLGIARRKAVDFYRSNRHTLDLEQIAETPHPGPLPEEMVDQQLRLDRVLHVLPLLSADRTEALSLRIFGGLSAAEVGAIMNRREDAVNMLVYRAIQDLQQRLAYLEES